LFTRIKSNRTAASKQGWGPLTYNLLDNEELKKIKNNKAIYHAYDQCELNGKTPITLNQMKLTNSLTGTIMDQYVDHKLREKASNKALHQQEEQTLLVSQEQFNCAVQMMARVAFNAHKVNLSNGTILQRVQEINRKKEEKTLAAANNTVNDFTLIIFANWGHVPNWGH